MKVKELTTRPQVVEDTRPTSEKQLDWLLTNWRRWCHYGNTGPELMGTGGEMTPDEKEARRAPRPVPPDPQAAWRVERSVVRLFDAQRKALREYWVYTKRGKDETEDHYRDRVRRKLKMPRWMFDQDLERARVELRRTLRELYGLPL